MANTYYVDGVNGDDAKDGLSEGNAFKTLAKAADMVAAGDKVWIEGTADYTAEDGANDCCVYLEVSGTAGSPITWEGYGPSLGDGYIVTLDGQSSFTNIVDGTGVDYQVFKNFEVKNASGGHGFETHSGNEWTFKNCSAHNNGGTGFASNDYCAFENCIAYNNNVGFSSDKIGVYVSCIAHTNTTFGITAQNGVIYHCLGYANGTTNFRFEANDTYLAVILGCTTDGEADADIGIHFDADVAAQYINAAVNNIIYDCSTGILSDADNKERVISRNNLFNDNNTNVTNWLAVDAGDGVGDRGDVTGAPAFTDEGADDYTLGSGSAAIDKGLDSGFTDAFWDSFIGSTNPPSP